MRYYQNPSEMYEEVKRDLAEMGIEVRPKTMQDKVIEGNDDFITNELQNYSYCLLNADSNLINWELNVNNPWADEEFKERIDTSHGPINPGEAYKLRQDVWDDYLHEGKFGYTYNERLNHNNQLNKVIERLKEDPDTRQAWVSVWDPSIDPNYLGGISRVPCSLGYGFQIRDGQLNMHYVMRSCDFVTHFQNDVYLAVKLLEYVAKELNVPVGNFTHTIFSLHVYKKDIKGVF